MTQENTKVLVFDFDGTLVNSMEAFADIAAEVIPKRHSLSAEQARSRYLETSGIPFFQQLEILFPNDPANKATAEEFEKAKQEGYLREPLFDDAAETLDHLRQKGLKVAVSSNNFQHLVEKYVGSTDIEFDMVLGFKENFSKGRDHFKYIEKTMNVDRKDIIFVGDSIKDGERAEDCGVSFIAKEGVFTKKQFKENFPNSQIIANLSELKDMF